MDWIGRWTGPILILVVDRLLGAGQSRKLRNYYLPWELEHEIGRFIEYYNHERVHESFDNLTPADVYLGRHREIPTARQRVKEQTIRRRRRINRGLAPKREERILPSLYRGVSITD